MIHQNQLRGMITLKSMIIFEDFKKVDIVVGKILSAEKVPDTDKLLKLSVDLGLSVANPRYAEGFGEARAMEGEGSNDIRTIVSGISLYFPDCSVLVGKKCMFVANLEPRVIRGIESAGMILAVSTSEGIFSLLEPNNDIPVGTRAK